MELKNSFCSGKTCHIIGFAVLLCLLLWFADTMMHVAVFRDRTFAEELVRSDPHKLLNFVQASVVLFLFMVFADFLMRKRRVAESALQGALATSLAEKSRSEGILEALGDAISIQDPTLRILYQNSTHREMMGEHVGEYCYRAYQQREKVCDGCLLVRALRDGRTYTSEKEGNTISGPVTVEITVSALRNERGEIVAGIEAVRDISERKRAEDEIVRLNRNLQVQTEELKAANSDLETFSYSVSHDLRTPLTRICCSAEALRSGYTDKLDETAQFFLENLCDASEQMHEIIEAMLDLSRVTRSELAIHELDLGLLARSVYLSLSRTWPLRRVEFSVAEGMIAHGDERMLRIVMENLIGNAWKYTERRDPARITVTMEQGDDGPVYVIRDNGAGFDMQYAELLFMPFNRLHKAADFPGTGIGLATVQRVIQRHGGRIWAESAPEAGATFRFTLPARHDSLEIPS